MKRFKVIHEDDYDEFEDELNSCGSEWEVINITIDLGSYDDFCAVLERKS